MKTLLSLFILWIWLLPAQAAIEAYQFKDAHTEALYNEWIDELRCLVCQNQNLADSDADLAKDLRQQTYEMLQQGKGRAEIIDYMVKRYGDFVLYRPPVISNTLLLWGGPFALLLVVLVVVFVRFRKPEPIDEPEQDAASRARSLLSEDGRQEHKS